MYQTVEQRIKFFVAAYVAVLKEIYTDIDRWIDHEHSIIHLAIAVPAITIIGTKLFFVVLLGTA